MKSCIFFFLLNFRVKARDCGPEMASILSGKVDELIAGPSLLPPRHTQRFRLELPTEIPVDVVHCSGTIEEFTQKYIFHLFLS